ncbi:Toll-like receptor 1 [Labeo rohita]|uniref:Toll-like receptor 1 n=1 Tax=Labeo rohita TaxID=84645 RepID=A0ABQ8LEQ9_LABRO|nr:Toll-like receptor 1 [Labeo rohita]
MTRQFCTVFHCIILSGISVLKINLSQDMVKTEWKSSCRTLSSIMEFMPSLKQNSNVHFTFLLKTADSL